MDGLQKAKLQSLNGLAPITVQLASILVMTKVDFKPELWQH
jgi:hypothetical protein